MWTSNFVSAAGTYRHILVQSTSYRLTRRRPHAPPAPLLLTTSFPSISSPPQLASLDCLDHKFSHINLPSSCFVAIAPTDTYLLSRLCVLPPASYDGFTNFRRCPFYPRTSHPILASLREARGQSDVDARSRPAADSLEGRSLADGYESGRPLGARGFPLQCGNSDFPRSELLRARTACVRLVRCFISSFERTAT